ncbi:MAG: DNA-3-methyladenine glycosylase I [Abditibacteriota bacterium]|nr:DNA-3-methyladenine glycosylase I [Abditibacteriota bacterium]
MGFCAWAESEPSYRQYHDEEWGVPVHDEIRMFEYLTLECMQCGLSWSLMLAKREVFRRCFAGFDYRAVAAFTKEDEERILNTPGMIRSPRKIKAVVNNARRSLDLTEEYGGLCPFFWSFTEGRVVIYPEHRSGRVPVSNGLSARVAAALKKRGFLYVGPVTMYSHLQSCGVINDHDPECPGYKDVIASHPYVILPAEGEVF